MELKQSNTWIEISHGAIKNNVAIFKRLAGADKKLMIVVKADAYGHSARIASFAAIEGGADHLGVFSVIEAAALREWGIELPILVLGPAFESELETAKKLNLTLTVPSVEAARQFSKTEHKPPRVHLKVETGTNRQGIEIFKIEQVLQILKSSQIEVEGIYTHFADIEDTTDHTFALTQLQKFKDIIKKTDESGLNIPLPHTACTAAAILFPDTYFAMLRVGIGTYGLWPSKETNVSAHAMNRDHLGLIPAMTWKTKIIQIKNVKAGEYVGYGRTFRATRDSKIAILPVGYADGYERSFSNTAITLVRGKRARVAGRVCMNLTMIDVTDIEEAEVYDEVILLGKSGDESVTAESLSQIAGTINYEIVTRAAPFAQRIKTD